MTLAETQALFYEAITSDAPLPPSRLEACFRGTPALPARERVAIYANMYRWRLVDALRQTFPNVARLLGDERFAALADDYLRLHPSEHHDIARAGRDLPSFLRENPTPERSDLGDLAELEWARQEVFFAAPAASLEADALSGLSPGDFERTGLALTSALQLLSLEHAVAPLWRRVESGEPPEPPLARPAFIAVWRVGFDVVHGEISAEEGAALGRARSGASLTEICAAFAGAADPARAAFRALSSWQAEGWIVGLRPTV